MTERILILAPRGRDAAVIQQVLERDGVRGQICLDLAGLRVCLENDVGGLLMTEEALAGPQLETLLDWFDQQEPWSDIPVIVLATKQPGHRSALAMGVLERLGNVVLLERPVNPETLASATRSAVRVRRRQYQTRSLLLDRERRERELRDLNQTLEQRVDERTRELDVAHETLAFALESAGMGSWDLELATDMSRRSIQHDRIFGYDTMQPSWGRQVFLSHVLEEDRSAATRALEDALLSGTLDFECRVRRADGAVRWVAAKGRVSYGPDRQAARMAGVLMDTTERRFTEDALHQAQKMEAIGQLTGGVAHDFNNLLTVIVGGLDLVMRRPDQPSRVVRLAEAAMAAARRGEQLTKQLLAFSRRQMLRPQTLRPNQLLREFEGLARRAVGDTIRMRLDLDPAADPIRIDPAQFESAVLNLVVNARDAMPSGGLITVKSRNVSFPAVKAGHNLQAGDYVVVSVTDTGTGIDDETLSRAFEPFFTTKEVGKGSGLGLSQVYGFARSAGGDVVIQSKLGRGTTVELYFPRSTDAPTEEHRPQPSTLPLRSAEAGETILLVEDDEEVLAMAVESIEELCYRVLIARNARQALDHIRGPGRIDIMFSDVMMPGEINGAQLAAEARRLRPGLKVLLTSGYVGDPASQHAIGDEVAVLTKPYRRDELAQKLSVVLGRH